MARKYFPFYFTFRDTAQTMTPKQRAAFYEAIIEYGATGVVPPLPKSISGYFPLIKPLLDTSQKRYEAGEKGGRPSKYASFGFDNSETNGFTDTITNGFNKEKEKEKEKEKPTAAAAAPAPHNGAMGDKPLLDSSLTQQSDPATEEARRKFFDSMKRPVLAAADAAPPDADTEDLEFV